MRLTSPIRCARLPPSVALLLLAILWAGGCGDDSPADGATARPEGRAAGVASDADAAAGPLLVAADVGFAPHVMARPDGTTEGFNVDLAATIAQRLGRPGYRIVDQEWSGMFAGLNAGRFEFIVAPTTMTEERSRSVLFVEGYLDTDYTFVIKADAPDITSIEDLRGETIAVNNGSAYDLWATEQSEQYGFEVQRYGKNADAIQAVVTGRCFANLASHTVAGYAAVQSPLVKTSYTIRTGLAFSAAFRNEDVEFRNRVEGILECMKTDGTMARLHERWFGAPPAAGAAAITVRPGYGEPGMAGYDPTPHSVQCDPPPAP